MIPTLRSLPDPLALRNHLAGVYDLPFTTCTLLRSLVNDVYELAAPDARYVLKLYLADGWEPAEILWETGLSAHLAAGLPVPLVHLLADGNEVGMLDSAEGERPFVLSGFVTGAKPRPPFTDDLYSGFGRLVARFHAVADTFPRRIRAAGPTSTGGWMNLWRRFARSLPPRRKTCSWTWRTQYGTASRSTPRS
ncbi:phosphotransferase family enzyme [Kribbella orskensis]|uniref:Phosphotransferase family enzyme n=1 Tax=Kribbella orskensis TaxID=2512216 RepID=A0ABY2BK78_9ACTN|nr:phosphotransferase family enzyme [Kribbella sp. VKM Ac-2500]TCO23001.1 phosphotransferase family enzyme [Kribbella orskensis]